jgi:hypothetical protein
VIEPTSDGTRVTAHRRRMIGDSYDQARACFIAPN